MKTANWIECPHIPSFEYLTLLSEFSLENGQIVELYYKDTAVHYSRFSKDGGKTWDWYISYMFYAEKIGKNKNGN